MIHSIVVDQEFESRIRPLSPEEYKTLKENIERDGKILDPIKVWIDPVDNLPKIVDGHNRYSIWLLLSPSIPAPRIEELNLPDRQSAIQWMDQNQRGRRNLTPDQILIEDLQAGRFVAKASFRVSIAKGILERAPGLAEAVRQGRLTLRQAERELEAPRPKPRVQKETASELAEHRAKNQLSELEKKNKRLLADLAAKDDELKNYKLVSRPPRPLTAQPRLTSKTRAGVPVMLCSDWHVEEPVDPAKVNGENEYNLEIAKACIGKLSDAFASMIQDSPRFECREGVIWLGGDLMSGYIHSELMESNLLSPQQAQSFLTDEIEEMLRKILALTNLDRIVLPCNSGNHGRATDKQRVSTREANSLEQVVYQNLARLFRNEPRLEFVIAEGEWVEIDVMGFKMAFTHGDSFSYGGGIGGVGIPIRRGINRQFSGRKIHQYCMGHFHTRQDLGDVQLNGSMIGYSPYSQRIHAAPEPRQQSWFMIDSERGKCLSAPLWL